MGGATASSNQQGQTPSPASNPISSVPQRPPISEIEQAIQPAGTAVQGLATGLRRWDQDLTSPLFPLPNAPQMQSKPAQIAAGIYQGAIKPLGEVIQSPVGIASMGVAGLGAIPARAVQAAFVPSLAKGTYESLKEAEKLSKDPNATTQDVSRAVSSAVGQGLGAVAGYKGALDFGAGAYLPSKTEVGSAGLGGPSSRMKESMKAIEEGLEEKPASPVTQFPTSEKGFYSQLQKVLHEKMPNNASVDQIRAIIDPSKGSGVKPDEIKWSNLEGFLEGKKNATKQEVLDYLKNEGAVKFEENTLTNRDQYEKQRNALGEKLANGEISAEEFTKLTKELGAKQRESKYSQYTIPNGENYREVVLTMPDDVKDQKQWRVLQKNGLGAGIYWDENIANQKAKDIGGSVEQAETIKRKPNYTSPHFKYIPNYVAHMRLNERPDSEGRNGLFIEEIQSDRHQAGREKGYNVPTPFEEIESSLSKKYGPNWKTEATKDEKKQYLEAFAENSKRGQVHDAPFRKDWHTQLFKRALRDAVDKGHDWIGWTIGDTQADRYNLANHVNSIEWDAKTNEIWVYGKNNETIIDGEKKTPEELPDLIGKDAAQRLIDSPTDKDGAKRLSGDGLKLEHKGMKGFYDQILPKEIGKYVKKWGAKVEEGELDNRQPEDNAYYEEPKPEHFTPIWKVKITPEMRKSIQQGGQPQVSKDTDIFANLV